MLSENEEEKNIKLLISFNRFTRIKIALSFLSVVHRNVKKKRYLDKR